VDAHRASEEIELQDILDQLGNPPAVTLQMIIEAPPPADNEFQEWLQKRENRRIIPHRFEKCGYVPVRNPYAKDGQWVIAYVQTAGIKGKRQTIYVLASLSLQERLKAAQDLAEMIKQKVATGVAAFMEDEGRRARDQALRQAKLNDPKQFPI
jgi:hypothetical protein